MRRLLPRTLAGRVILVLLVGLTAFHVGSLWLHQSDSAILLGSTQRTITGERLAAAARALMLVPEAGRGQVAEAMSAPGFALRWAAEPVTEGNALRRSGHQEVEGSMALPDGSRIDYHVDPLQSQPEHAIILSTSAMALGILVLGLLVVRLIARPLRQLAEAADRIGHPGVVAILPVEGPVEVRQAVRAFNRMQARIDRLIADRTQALAAVSHDLRTPLARLRLRAGFLDDIETQRQVDTDLDEMETMIAATLAYLRGEEEQEDTRTADLAAILQTLIADAEDLGRDVRYAGPPLARLACRAVSLKRAFANLIDNAVKYGAAARVTLRESSSEFVVLVEDDGPGIPPDELERVFEPFHRLDRSRNRGTGGSGLGLTIARQAVTRHGGTVELANNPEGGLQATVRLPRARPKPGGERGTVRGDAFGASVLAGAAYPRNYS